MQFTSEQIRGIGITSQRSRDAMVQRLIQNGIKNQEVLNAMAYMPRHLFIEEGFNYLAYKDQAVPLSKGQTISQPMIVAKMTEELLNAKVKKVLEIGTGSGYQTAILAYLGMEVFSIERIEHLHKNAKKILNGLNLSCNLKLGDGYLGWEDMAPFDGIIVTAAAPTLPAKLAEQLQINAKLIIPIEEDNRQILCSYTKTADSLNREILAEVKFVPMLAGIINDR